MCPCDMRRCGYIMSWYGFGRYRDRRREVETELANGVRRGRDDANCSLTQLLFAFLSFSLSNLGKTSPMSLKA